MSKIAVIGGTGLTSLQDLKIIDREIVQTPFGEPSGPLVRGELSGQEILFLPRHGGGHTIPPHKVNYRANIWALHKAGAEYVIAVNAVGGIASDMPPGCLVVPDQIIDYTWSRTTTFFEEGLSQVVHIDFTEPYCESLRQKLIAAADSIDCICVSRGVYGATQGPRLETAAEISRMERDGCDLVGMTGMPEAALARELELCYACVAVVANAAAGKSDEPITMEIIEHYLNSGMSHARHVLEAAIPAL